MRRARDLHFLSARTITSFAVTAESVESVLVDAQAFLQAGVTQAALECLEEVRNHVAEMHSSSQVVQTEYRRLANDVQKVLRGAEQASPPPAAVRPRIVPDEPSAATMSLLSRISSGEISNLTDEQQLDLLEILGVLNLAPSSPSIADEPAEPAGVIARPAATEEEVNLLSLAARDLRRVDAILERCRFFWSNVEHCVLRLNQFKEAAARLLDHARASDALFARYNERMSSHQQFWQAFGATCKEYAAQAQIEYQQAVDIAAALADAVDTISRPSPTN